jgi:pimeloyl-ACP methyl ester carboxylesterase
VPRFVSYDGTEISYHLTGSGPPLVCVPGGPGRAVEYLGDLGGLNAGRQLVLVDLRGVGESADPTDPETLRADRLVDDLEALRVHLGLERMDLLAHSAGCVLATLYAATYPQRLAQLVLVTPGLAAVGVSGSHQEMADLLAQSAAAAWYPDAIAGWQKISTGDLSLEAFRASRPLFYARWGGAEQAHSMLGAADRHMTARLGYFNGINLDVPATRAVLARLDAPVLLYGGELDPLVTPSMLEAAAPLFAEATVVVQHGARHFPWVDDAGVFASAVAAFLA